MEYLRQVHLRVFASSRAKTHCSHQPRWNLLWECQEELVYTLHPFLHSMFFFNVILCNRCEAAAMLHLRSFYLILQTKVSWMSQETYSFVHHVACWMLSLPSSLWAAEKMVALTLSFLGLKNTVLPCTVIRDSTSDNYNLWKDKKTLKQ